MVADYEGLGFRSGIEIHQQIDTHKLFCSCPSLIREDTPDISVKRRMRAVSGELGNVDPAALHEFLRDRILDYQAYGDTTCLVELDEEPPHDLNRQALKMVVEAALLLDAKVLDEVHVMRKTVIDGSNTSGFQRTMLVAVDGKLETSRGVVRIPSICLEEDAARIIGTQGNEVTYRLDRLGIPLVEIATDPDIKDAAHARETAEKIGSILRACKVKRGLGTIRQDINISIRDGERIEVKGVQDLKLISKVVESEVSRQVMLIKAKKELAERGSKPSDYDVKPHDVTRLFASTKSTVVRSALEKKGIMLAVTLPHLDGLLKGRLGPQIAQYGRAASSLKGLFHSDELPAYGVSPEEVESLRKELKITGDDAFAMVSGPHDECIKALTAALNRCKTALECVPEETRRAKDDGDTEYMRPLPGSARMYPETDEPLVPITKEYVEKIREGLPELREDKAKRYVKLGLSGELASQLSRSGKDKLFEELATAYAQLNPTVIATSLTSILKESESRYETDASQLTTEHYRQVMDMLDKGSLTQNTLAEAYARICEHPGEKVASILEKNGLTVLSEAELTKIVTEVVKDNKDLIIKLGDKAAGPLTGKVMAKARGRADAKKVSELLGRSLP
ncbi:Glu-tRNA(Gln) amidotransferase subunit GatE [Candidatus Altiarchaeota archaeon]